MSLIEFFSRQAPQRNLSLREASGQRLIELLLAGEIDVALVALPDYPGTLLAQALFSEDYVITFPSGHRFEALPEVRVDDLRGERYLERLNCEYLSFYEAEGHRFHDDLDARFESEHESWVQAMVIARLGCAVMPESLARHPGLRHRPLIAPRMSRTISVVTKRGRLHIRPPEASAQTTAPQG